MGEILHRAVIGNVPFWVLNFFAVALIAFSFAVPPLGIIDGSVLAAVGEVFAFAALATVVKAIDKGTTAKVSHNDTTLEIGEK